MASSAFVVAHENEFNGAVLEDDALYFTTAEEVTEILNQQAISSIRVRYIDANRKKSREFYTWENIINSYEDLFLKLAKKKPH